VARSFIDSALRKVERARKLIDAAGRDIRLEVDGGIKIDNIRCVAAAGADTFVAGQRDIRLRGLSGGDRCDALRTAPLIAGDKVA